MLTVWLLNLSLQLHNKTKFLKNIFTLPLRKRSRKKHLKKLLLQKKCATAMNCSSVAHPLLFKCITLRKAVLVMYSINLFNCITL